MYTLENSSCDYIRKENGKWGFYRNSPSTEFKIKEEAEAAQREIYEQYPYIKDIEVIKE